MRRLPITFGLLVLMAIVNACGDGTLVSGAEECFPYNPDTGNAQELIDGRCVEVPVGPSSTSITFPTSTTSTTITTTTSPTTPQASSVKGLTAEEALSWCSGSACQLSRFVPLEESNGLVNPRGITMTTGEPVALSLPAGVSGDIWDCFALSEVDGPIMLDQVCEASLRKMT